MKNETMSKHSILMLLLIVLSAPATFSAAQDAYEVTIPLSEPGEPVTLVVSLRYGGITVEGQDDREVVVRVVPLEQHQREEHSDGKRRIPNTSLGIVIKEHDNVVEVHGDNSARVSWVHVKMPRQASLHLSSVNGGDLRVRGIRGQLELKKTNGTIEALDIDGSVVANTTAGDIKVTFDRIAPDKPMSFVSLSGDLDVTFPENLRADLRIAAGQGDIFTDFEFTVKPENPAVETSREGGRYRVTMQREVRASVGGGGPEMHFKTWSGNVTIRKP
jgi:hypothetical protein